ncbi:MAG: replication-relaxation family protein [Gammaproteobacteria bacterium]
MMITKRDIEILKFINEFGFCEITQIETKFGLKKTRGYQIMKRLVDEKFVVHERIFHGVNGVFYLTKKGADYTDLPTIKMVPRETYSHQLAIIDIFFKLSKQYPDATWIGERRIKRDKYAKGIGKAGHIADGMLIFPDKDIAIEVELTMKSKRRVLEIFRNYLHCFDIKEVWYYCSPQIINRIQKLADNTPHIKIYSL